MLKQLLPVLLLTASSVVLADMVVTTTVRKGSEEIERHCTQVNADCSSEICVGEMKISLCPGEDAVTVGMALEDHPMIASRTVAWSEGAEFECCSDESDAIVTVTVDRVE